MKPKRKSNSTKAADPVLEALRRAGRKAVELGRLTGTPAYVLRNGRIVDAARRSTNKRTRGKA